MLNKKYRLTKRGSFNYVYNKGERTVNNLLTIVFVRGKNLRVGFSVSNKIGKAVVRNKLKRRLRSIIKTLIPNMQNAQIVIVARQGASEASYNSLDDAVKNLLNRSKLLLQGTI